HFSVEPDNSVQTAGAPFNVTITALDVFNNIILDYASRAALHTFTFTTTAGNAPNGTAPLLTALSAIDFLNGVATKSATLYQAVSGASITFSVTESGAGKGGTTSLTPVTTVNAGSAFSIRVSGMIDPITLGVSIDVSVTMLDPYDNVAPNYTGTITFNSPAPNADPLATHPGTFGWTGQGQHTFVSSITFRTSGSRTIQVSAPGLISGSQTVFVNQAPIASDDGARSTNEDESMFINVLANDTDPELNALSIIAVTQPSNGMVTIRSGGLNVLYVPNENYFGPDTFTYTVSDGVIGGTDQATVAISVLSVNDPPVALNDIIGVAENKSAAALVLANDTDVDSDPLTITSITQPAHGHVTLNSAAGTITYAAEKNFDGSTMFSYTISDGKGGVDSATVTVNVSNDNTPPSAKPDTFILSVNSVENSLEVLANDTDAENDNLQITAVDEALHGQVNIDPSGLFIRYTPEAGYAGDDQFAYTISDGFDESTATVNLSVTNPQKGSGGFLGGIGGVIAGGEEPLETAPETAIPDNRLTGVPDAFLSVVGASYTSPQILVFGPDETPAEKTMPMPKLNEYTPLNWNLASPGDEALEEKKDEAAIPPLASKERSKQLQTKGAPAGDTEKEKARRQFRAEKQPTAPDTAITVQTKLPAQSSGPSLMPRLLSFFNSVRIAAGFGFGEALKRMNEYKPKMQ
ncbi:MAG: tandem-95 repeat protein, partial [Candidatus Omnitrophica bacterium]|nr:tandem-95 repeat protein [Candidatus Omnitrophota bacterium]